MILRPVIIAEEEARVTCDGIFIRVKSRNYSLKANYLAIAHFLRRPNMLSRMLWYVEVRLVLSAKASGYCAGIAVIRGAPQLSLVDCTGSLLVRVHVRTLTPVPAHALFHRGASAHGPHVEGLHTVLLCRTCRKRNGAHNEPAGVTGTFDASMSLRAATLIRPLHNVAVVLRADHYSGVCHLQCSRSC